MAKSELHISRCGFNHYIAHSFVSSEWQSKMKSVFYLTYRWLFAVFVTSVYIFALYEHIQKPSSIGKFFIYMTRWGLTLNFIVGIYGVILVTVWHKSEEYRNDVQRKKTIPRAFKIYWAIHNMALDISILVTIVYWSVLYKGKPIDLANILSHAINSVVMFVDFLVVAFPMRLYHVIQPICFGVCYAVFTYIYYLCDGRNMKDEPFVYSVLDWSKPQKAFRTVIGVIILVIFIHFVMFWMQKLRVFIRRRFFTTKHVLPFKHEESSTVITGNEYL